MDFKKATDQLCEATSHGELASALGVSVATIRQARLEPTAKAHRSPPPDWAEGVKAIAASKLARIQKLLSDLDSTANTGRAASRARFDEADAVRSNIEPRSGRSKPGSRRRQHG
jgi:hypothetical protein